jgi:hypothetical protein
MESLTGKGIDRYFLLKMEGCKMKNPDQGPGFSRLKHMIYRAISLNPQRL